MRRLRWASPRRGGEAPLGKPGGGSAGQAHAVAEKLRWARPGTPWRRGSAGQAGGKPWRRLRARRGGGSASEAPGAIGDESIDGEDLATALTYKDTKKAIAMHVKEKHKCTYAALRELLERGECTPPPCRSASTYDIRRKLRARRGGARGGGSASEAPGAARGDLFSKSPFPEGPGGRF